MEFERLSESYEPVEKRLKHYKEFVQTLTVEDAKFKALLYGLRDTVLQQQLPGKTTSFRIGMTVSQRRLEAGSGCLAFNQ